MRAFIFPIILLFSTSALIAQVTQGKDSSEKAATEKTQADRGNSSSMSADETAALREDIARMRAILGQMETNLAFVDTTQSPLKHQFQLEIDMWNTVIIDMERRTQTAGKIVPIRKDHVKAAKSTFFRGTMSPTASSPGSQVPGTRVYGEGDCSPTI